MGEATDLALPRVKLEEGFRPYPYHDSKGNLTVGYGLNLDSPMPERLASVICQWWLDEMEMDCQQFGWFKSCDPIRQSVLVDMAFNMEGGIAGLLQFKNMLAACMRQDWQTAHDQMLWNSPGVKTKWYEDVGARAERLAQIMLTGEK